MVVPGINVCNPFILFLCFCKQAFYNFSARLYPMFFPDLPEPEPVKSEPPVIEDSYGLDDLLRALKEETE